MWASLWLTIWTSSTSNPGAGRPGGSVVYYLGIFTLISLLQVALSGIQTAIFKRCSLVASTSLHDMMLHKLLRSPLSFFHTNPIGRIINRCTKDVTEMDKNVADTTNMFARAFLTLISTCVLMGTVSPLLLPFLVVVMVIFYFIYLFFQASVRETKRLESISYSPLYTSLTDAISGLASIRAYHQEERLISTNRAVIDSTSRFSLAQQSFNRWLSVRQESLGSFMAFLAAVISIEERGSSTSAVMGLVVSYALTISSSVAQTVRTVSMAEVSFNSVDRVIEYCGLQEEAELVVEGSTPNGWPSAGHVKYEGVKMRYRDGLPLVLNGLDIEFSAGSKCGVVGRTGAGKSSLINTLFRLMELDSGVIRVDGVDIRKIGLHQLRRSLSIIPQVWPPIHERSRPPPSTPPTRCRPPWNPPRPDSRALFPCLRFLQLIALCRCRLSSRAHCASTWTPLVNTRTKRSGGLSRGPTSTRQGPRLVFQPCSPRAHRARLKISLRCSGRDKGPGRPGDAAEGGRGAVQHGAEATGGPGARPSQVLQGSGAR